VVIPPGPCYLAIYPGWSHPVQINGDKGKRCGGWDGDCG